MNLILCASALNARRRQYNSSALYPNMFNDQGTAEALVFK